MIQLPILHRDAEKPKNNLTTIRKNLKLLSELSFGTPIIAIKSKLEKARAVQQDNNRCSCHVPTKHIAIFDYSNDSIESDYLIDSLDHNLFSLMNRPNADFRT